jgi:hypothetical protein
MHFSDYIVYADESGDHSLTSINPQNPVFVLVFIIFHKDAFIARAVPAVQRLKFDFWGHDGVVLHSHDIRKSYGDFNILLRADVRDKFLSRLSALMSEMPMTLIAAAIDKHRHIRRYKTPANPYELALAFCIERLRRWLHERGQAAKETHILFERRGRTEDDQLELEFRRLTEGNEQLRCRFMDKRHNSTGLQIADLAAHPIGRHVINQAQANRAFEILRPKFRAGPAGRIQGYGLKVFP